MKKIVFILGILLFANMAVADGDIPVFDDPIDEDRPNIGREAEPLGSLVLTPKPLPEVEVELKNTKKETPPPPPPAEPTPKIVRTEPITLKKDQTVIDIQVKEEPPVAVSTPPAPKVQQVQKPDFESLFGKLHDVHSFEIAGIALGMTVDEVLDAMKAGGFKRTKIQYGIPMFRTSFYEQNCRDKKIYLPADIRKCIERQADQDDVKYVSSMTFAREASKEYIRVLFSTHATDNVVYKVYYESKGDNSLTLTQVNLAKQLRRKNMFWNMMFETYGLPDDPELIVWGDPTRAYMQAIMVGSSYNAYIVLEDKEIQDKDYFDAEDEAPYLPYKVPFTFAPVPGEE